MSPGIEEMIGDPKMMVVMAHNDNVKVVQDEESREEEPCTPERIRNPAIQVVIIPGRRIVGDNRRPFVIVIVVDFLRLNVFATCGRLTLCVLARPRRDR
jgi:hypothetical protein